MPAIGPQGSRGGLIAAVVVFTILFVTATIFAIYFGVDDNKKTDALQTQMERTKQIYSASDVILPRFVELQHKSGTILSSAFHDSQALADTIAGKNDTFKKTPELASQQAQAALTEASKQLPNLNISSDMPLISVINKLVTYTKDQQYQNTELRHEQTQSAGDAAKQIALEQERADKAEQDAADNAKARADAVAQVQAAEVHYQQLAQQMSASIDKDHQQMNQQLQKVQTAMEEKNRELVEAQRATQELTDKLARRRISPLDPLLAQSDGYIESVPSDDIVYINLGAGDHIVPGMTFEVYNRREGIPKQDDLLSEDDMPVGIGSIQVEQILSGVSECRIIKTEVGQHIGVGDLIANLVYDRNTKYNFVIYGDFDLAQTGKPKPAEAAADNEKIKALVTQWGGHIQNQINADTDFVVMGIVPKVESFTEDELQDPLNKQIQDDEKAKFDKYQAVLEQAEKLDIPVMNQNRFLYFCGYYNSAQQ